MSQSMYIADMARTMVKQIIDQANLAQTNPTHYQILMSSLYPVNGGSSQGIENLITNIDQRTNGQWRNGIAAEQLRAIIQPWVVSTLDAINKSLMSQNNFQQPPQNYGVGSGYGAPLSGMSPTNNMYGSIVNNVPMSPIQFPSMTTTHQDIPSVPPTTQKTFYSHTEHERAPVLNLNKASIAEISTTPNGILTVSDYFTGEYENSRVLLSKVDVKVAVNNATDLGKLVFTNSPQEIIRGTFANFVSYNEIFHIAAGSSKFAEVADVVWSEFSKDNNWRTVVKILNSRTKGEWEMMNRAICRILNPLIYRKLRTSQKGVCILGIDSIEDLADLDDRNANFQVAKHKDYWTIFNGIVNTAMNLIFNPQHRIGIVDENFGDFIQCDKIAFYSDGRSKYDYGTFKEKVDHRAFLNKLMEYNTVLRIPRVNIFTNGLHPELIQRISTGRETDQVLLHELKSVGASLLGQMEIFYQSDAEYLVNLHSDNGVHRYDCICVGRTLDHDTVLLA